MGPITKKIEQHISNIMNDSGEPSKSDLEKITFLYMDRISAAIKINPCGSENEIFAMLNDF